jgi:O-antigen/teichoic acid export membrane protein
MFRYSSPLVMNTVAWWINNASDRYVVTWLCGVEANGVYSMAYKIPSILNMFQSIFNQAWTLSAVKEYNADSSKFYTSVYNIYNCGMVLVCTCMILGNQFIAKLLFANEFYEAWHFAPFLMISVVFGALSGMIGGVFTAAKKSSILSTTTMMGAICNTVLNIVLVYYMGPMGAALATLAAYVLVWASRMAEARKIVKLKIRFARDITSYAILLLQAIALVTIRNIPLRYGSQLVCFAAIIFLYRTDIKTMLQQILKRGGQEKETL